MSEGIKNYYIIMFISLILRYLLALNNNIHLVLVHSCVNSGEMISWSALLFSWSTCPHISYARWARCMFTCRGKVTASLQSRSRPYQAPTVTDVLAVLLLLWETSTMMDLMVKSYCRLYST